MYFKNNSILPVKSKYLTPFYNRIYCILVKSKYLTPISEIFNTDQESQYTSYIHTQTLASKGIVISMDSKGRATDNIAIERFWRSAKCERIYLNEYSSIRELKDDVKEYIEFYNHKRFHETLDYRKPMNVYYESLSINNKKFDALGKKIG